MLKFFLQLFRNLFKPNISPTALVYAGSQVARTAFVHRACKVRNSSLGANSYIAAHTWLTNTDVGRFCSIGNHVISGLASHTFAHISTSPVFTLRRNAVRRRWVERDLAENSDDFPRTVIADDVWVGSNVMIMSGVSIGVGAVIGAGAVVTKDVPPYAIAVGVPAKVIKYRFDDAVRQKLLASRWWEQPDSVLRADITLFQQPLTAANADQILAKWAQNQK